MNDKKIASEVKQVKKQATIWDKPLKLSKPEIKESGDTMKPVLVKPSSSVEHIDNMDIAVGSKLVKDGRIACECQAQLHPLVNNCLDCGRIICAYEGTIINRSIAYQHNQDPVPVSTAEITLNPSSLISPNNL